MAADNGFNLTANGTAVFKGYAPISGWQWLASHVDSRLTLLGTEEGSHLNY